MKGMSAKIDELTAKVARLEREIARRDARPAQPNIPRHGWWMAVLQGGLKAQGTATAKIIVWDATDEEWKYLVPAQTVTVQDFWMNNDESIEAGTRIKVVWYFNVWTWDQAYCAVADNLPDES